MTSAVARRRDDVAAAPPVAVGLTASALGALFVALRLVVAAHRDVTRFVVAGTRFVDPRTVRPRLHVFRSAGYDGQFYWRIAVAPTAHQLGAVHGVQIDQPIRLTRLVYPLLAWVGSAGQPAAVVWSLIAVNVIALGLLAGLAGRLAGDHGATAWTGLLVAAASGLVMSISRDLCEVVMLAALVGGILALERRRPWLAAAAFTVAVLTHEQVALVVAAYGLHRVWGIARGRSRPGGPDLPWVVPGVAFAACQLVFRGVTGSIPLLSFGGQNASFPFADLSREIGRYVTGDIHRQSILFLPQLALVVATVALAVSVHRAVPPSDRWLLWALAASSLLGLSLSDNVWMAPSELRQVMIVPTVAWLILIVARRRPPLLLCGATATVWLLTVGLRVLAI